MSFVSCASGPRCPATSLGPATPGTLTSNGLTLLWLAAAKLQLTRTVCRRTSHVDSARIADHPVIRRTESAFLGTHPVDTTQHQDHALSQKRNTPLLGCISTF